jgi:hypothetical protein
MFVRVRERRRPTPARRIEVVDFAALRDDRL